MGAGYLCISSRVFIIKMGTKKITKNIIYELELSIAEVESLKWSLENIGDKHADENILEIIERANDGGNFNKK